MPRNNIFSFHATGKSNRNPTVFPGVVTAPSTRQYCGTLSVAATIATPVIVVSPGAIACTLANAHFPALAGDAASASGAAAIVAGVCAIAPGAFAISSHNAIANTIQTFRGPKLAIPILLVAHAHAHRRHHARQKCTPAPPPARDSGERISQNACITYRNRERASQSGRKIKPDDLASHTLNPAPP
jgi:hypothetical protein